MANNRKHFQLTAVHKNKNSTS